jgi:hypothetical protein
LFIERRSFVSVRLPEPLHTAPPVDHQDADDYYRGCGERGSLCTQALLVFTESALLSARCV